MYGLNGNEVFACSHTRTWILNDAEWPGRFSKTLRISDNKRLSSLTTRSHSLFPLVAAFS